MGKRGRPCTICQHPKRDEIDKLLAPTDANFAAISRDFAGISEDALKRHKEIHIPELLSKSTELKALADQIESADIHKGDTYLQLVIGLQKKALDALELQDATKDPKSWAMISREARGYVELMGKALDRIRDTPPAQITIINNPEWIELRTVIIQALDPYPEAKEAMVLAIRER